MKDIMKNRFSEKQSLSSKLLEWYDLFGRDLPWRMRGAHSNPYVVWISEIMLQQTTVKTVIPYFYRFTEKYPTIESLAAADIEDVLLLWQGLGYYTRARKLHECARLLTNQNGGEFPKTYKELLKLPGIGPYTAASISSLAFDQREAVVDGNVIRVISRLYGILESTSESLPTITKKAQELMPETRAADYTSAIMDLGATVCTPKNPTCESCPFQEECVALRDGLIEIIPKIEKLQKIKKVGKLFWIENETGEVFIQKRTEKGLLHGLTEFPWAAIEFKEASRNKNAAAESETDLMEKIPFPIESRNWMKTGKPVKHIFTHIHLTLNIFKIKLSSADFESLNKSADLKTGQFVKKENFEDYPFSTLMKKVIKEAEKTGNQSEISEF